MKTTKNYITIPLPSEFRRRNECQFRLNKIENGQRATQLCQKENQFCMNEIHFRRSQTQFHTKKSVSNLAKVIFFLAKFSFILAKYSFLESEIEIRSRDLDFHLGWQSSIPFWRN